MPATPPPPPPPNSKKPVPMPPVASASTPGPLTTDMPKISYEPTVARKVGQTIVFQAVEGWGKTTLGAYADKPFMLMSDRERGYETLLQYGLVPAIPSLVCEDWQTAMGALDQLLEDDHDRETIVLDAASGFEYLCHSYMVDTQFSGEWGERGFLSYNKGPKQSLPTWRTMLDRLERLKEDRGMNVLVLSHIQVKKFSNPDGSDYDRYVSDLNEHTWTVTNKWADAVLFGKFYEVFANAEEAKKTMRKGGSSKVIGERHRVIYTDRRDSHDAKNRMGMPTMIEVQKQGPGVKIASGETVYPAANWLAIASYIQKGITNE